MPTIYMRQVPTSNGLPYRLGVEHMLFTRQWFDRGFQVFLVMFAGVFLGVLAIRPNGDTGLVWFSDIALTSTTVLGGLAIILFALGMHGRDKRSWLLIGSATLTWGLGMFVWSWYELALREETPFPSLADLGYLGYLGMIPLMLMGLLTLPMGRIAPEGRIKAMVDAALIMASIATVSWFAVLGPIFSQSDATLVEKAIGGAYPAGDVLLMFALIGGVARGWIGRRDPVVIPLVVGIGLFIFADFGFNYLTLHDAYVSGSPIDIGWPLGFLFVTYAALRRWAQGPTFIIGAESQAPAALRPSALRQVAPYVLVLGVAALLFYGLASDSSGEQNVFVGLALITMMLVLGRQFITLRENERLNHELLDFSQRLELTVEERTARLAALHSLAARLSGASSKSVLDDLLRDAAQEVGKNLDVEYTQILELHPLRRRFLYRAGVGWGEGPDRAQLRVSRRREAGYALRADSPVIMENASQEARFTPLDSDAMRGIVSGATVVVPPQDRPFGVLSVHSTRARTFTADGVSFLQSVANVLGQAIDRIRAEDQLRLEHTQTEQLLESISSILVGVDSEGRVQLWNRAAAETFSVSSEDVVGTLLRDVPLLWEWAPIERAAARCREIGESVRIDDVPYRDEDQQTEVFLSLAVNPITHDFGNESGYLIIGMDITDRRALEAQLTQAQKIESIGQLAAGIAHEINTPTQYIGDNTKFLRDAFKHIDGMLARFDDLLAAVRSDGDPKATALEAEEYAKKVNVTLLREEVPPAIQDSLNGVERVARIVRAMKVFSHPGAETKTPTDINEAIESTVTVASNEWKDVAELTLDLDESLPLVPCRPGEFNQVILNLVVNAADAIADANDNGAKGQLTVSTQLRGDHAEIKVSDTGTGIPEAAQPRIFDPFFTTKEVGRGTGQGLAISRSVVIDKHDGTLTFETRRGKGTTFTIRLPLGEALADVA